MGWSPTVALTLTVMLLFSGSGMAKPPRLNTGMVKLPKTYTNASLCEPKYLELSPKHTRCLEDHPKARLLELSTRTKDHILMLHNMIRSNVDPPASNMMKLQWDDNLAVTATKWVMQCKGDHDHMKDREEPDWPSVKIGQNMGFGHKSWKIMIERLYSEKERLNYAYGGGYLNGAGHFFQLVTARSTRIGCGMAECPHTKTKTYRACNYAPALNSAQPPYQNGTSCGDCPEYCHHSRKLCDCRGMLCYNGGSLDPRTCKCICRVGKTGDHCERVDCSIPDPFPSCRNGVYSREDCGKKHTVLHDPKTCPHLCGLCDKPCGGLECKNGGTLNWDTCQCGCPGLLTGDTCETCPRMDKAYCTTFLPRSECSDIMKESDCPIYCGICNTTCPVCQNLGDLNTEDCSCTCKGAFTGATCEICPAQDEEHCGVWDIDYCTKTPNTFAFMQTRCPYRCGACPALDSLRISSRDSG